jgi:hypothetical protein
MKISVLVAASAAAFVAASASAAVVAGWSFDAAAASVATGTSSNAGAADLGALTAGTLASGVHVASATAWSTPAGNGSAKSFSSNNWATGDYYQFSLSTLNYTNIAVSFDQASSNTGPTTFALSVSTNGGVTFTRILASYTVQISGSAGPGIWSSGTNLTQYTISSAAAAANNQSSVIFRLSSSVTPATTGTSRVDNFSVTGDLVPAPGSLALLGLGGLVAGRRRR